MAWWPLHRPLMMRLTKRFAATDGTLATFNVTSSSLRIASPTRRSIPWVCSRRVDDWPGNSCGLL